MSLNVITSPLLDVAGVRHAFFTRTGGVSAGIYESLNVGLGSGDDPQAVLENRARQFLALTLQVEIGWRIIHESDRWRRGFAWYLGLR